MNLRPIAPDDVMKVSRCVHRAFGHYVERIGCKPDPMLMDYEHGIREHRVHLVKRMEK